MFNLYEYLNERYRFGLGNKNRELLLRGNDLFDRFHYRLKDGDIPSLCTFLATCEVWSLDICYNRITDDGLCTLAKYIKESSHEFISLNLMCNDISSVGVQALCDIGPDLKIKSLRLNGNKFGTEGGKALSGFLGNNDHLQHLDIGETDQSIESIVYIAAVLRNPDTKLRSLNLSRPLIKFSESHAAEILGQMIFMNMNLKELVLQKCGLMDHDIELLALGLHKYKNERFLLPTREPPAVKYKEVKSCSSYETVTSVEKYMKGKGLWEQMKDGMLSENLSGKEQAFEHMAEDKENSESSTESDYQDIKSENLVENTPPHSLSDSYPESGDSEYRFTEEADQKAELITDSEKNEPKMRTLQANQEGVSDLTLHDETAANPLKRLISKESFVSNLRRLDLSCNSLSDFSIKYLGPYLLSKPPLMILNLAFNMIGDEGAVELSRYLPSTSIEVLDISHNNIDFDGIQNLIYRLKQPAIMRKLYIWGNRPNIAVLKYLREVIEMGNILQENIDMKIYQIDGIEFAAFNQECEDEQSEYYCVRKTPLYVNSELSPCMQRLKETTEKSNA